MRCVADDEHPVGRELDPVFFARPPERDGTQVVAVFAVIRERPKCEKMREAVMVEFDAGAALHVAGEDCLRAVAASGQRVQCQGNAGQNAAARIFQRGGQFRQVRGKQPGEIRFAVWKPNPGENLPHDPGIGAPGEIDPLGGRGCADAEFPLQRDLERPHPRATGEGERAIDVPEQQGFHAEAADEPPPVGAAQDSSAFAGTAPWV